MPLRETRSRSRSRSKPRSRGLENLNDLHLSILSTWAPDPETERLATSEITRRMRRGSWSDPTPTEKDLVRFNLIEPENKKPRIKQRKHKGSTDKYENCPICLRDFRQNQIVYSLKNCDHVYHEKCLSRYLVDFDLESDEKVKCPVCRTLSFGSY